MLLFSNAPASAKNLQTPDTLENPHTENIILEPAPSINYPSVSTPLKFNDSIPKYTIAFPEKNRKNRFADSVFQTYAAKTPIFGSIIQKQIHQPIKNRYNTQTSRYQAELWIILLTGLIMFLFVLIRNIFFKELNLLIQAFYNNRALDQIKKEALLYNSSFFFCLHLQFTLTIAVFVYLNPILFPSTQAFSTMEYILYVSIGMIVLFLIKILFVRFLGFLFATRRLIDDYIALLYTTYFNASILFLPIIIIDSLLFNSHIAIFNYICLGIIVLLFLIQFVRGIVHTILQHKFPVLYLFIYVCALEISPLLVIYKLVQP